MAFDDQRGRTSDFSNSIRLPDPVGGPQPNYAPAVTPQFLGGETGGFLQGGGNGGGFTNFSQYLFANPGGSGFDPGTTTPGQTGIDAAINKAYGVHDYGPGGPPPPPPPGGKGTGVPGGGPMGGGGGGPTGGPGWSSGGTPTGGGFTDPAGPPALPPPPPPPPPGGGAPPDDGPFTKRLK